MIGQPIFVEAVGFLAGTLIAVSAAPRLLGLIKNRSVAASESIARNLLLVIGNVLWVVVGLLTPSLSIAAMCSVASLLNGAVLFVVIRAKHLTEPPHH